MPRTAQAQQSWNAFDENDAAGITLNGRSR
jgi:hypothetical protein